VTTKYTFKQEYSGFTGFSEAVPPTTITMEVNGELSLPQIVERFEEFLRGAGFHFNGHLDFVNDDDVDDSKDQDDDNSQDQGDDINLDFGDINIGSTYTTMGDQTLTLKMPEKHSTYYYDYSRNK